MVFGPLVILTFDASESLPGPGRTHEVVNLRSEPLLSLISPVLRRHSSPFSFGPPIPQRLCFSFLTQFFLCHRLTRLTIDTVLQFILLLPLHYYPTPSLFSPSSPPSLMFVKKTLIESSTPLSLYHSLHLLTLVTPQISVSSTVHDLV